MKQALISIAVVLAGIVVSGCAASSTPESGVEEAPTTESPAPAVTPIEVECPSTPIEVAIEFETEQNVENGALIHVRSNLPDSAELLVSLDGESGTYMGQDTAPLIGGEAEFGPFTDDGLPLHGAYELSITLPIARNQPVQVQNCIGSEGENLTGPLVSEEEITGDNVASISATVVFD